VPSTPSLTFAQGGGTVPFTTKLAPGQDIELASVTATWDAAGASGTFLPCLSIYSQEGVLLSRTFPSQTLTTGDSGEVTFSPFLAAAAAAAPAASGTSKWAALATTYNSHNQTIASGVPTLLTWYGFETDDTATFDTGLLGFPPTVVNAAGDTALIVNEPGVLVVDLWALWDSSGFSRFIDQTSSGHTLDHATGSIASNNQNDVYQWSHAVYYFDSSLVPGFVRFDAHNNSGSNKVMNARFVSAVLHPTTEALITVY